MRHQNATARSVQTYIPSYYPATPKTNISPAEILEIVNRDFSISSVRWLYEGTDEKGKKNFSSKSQSFGTNSSFFIHTKNISQLHFICAIITNTIAGTHHSFLDTTDGQKISEKFKSTSIFKKLRAAEVTRSDKSVILNTLKERFNQIAEFYDKTISFSIDVSKIPVQTRQPLAQISASESNRLQSSLSSRDPRSSSSSLKSSLSLSSSSSLQNPTSASSLPNACSSGEGSSLSSSPIDLTGSLHSRPATDALHAPYKKPRLKNANKDNSPVKGLRL